MYMIITGGLALVAAILIPFILPYIFGPPKACNLTSVLRRDFKNYYGLVIVENPLSHYNAEQGESMNGKCHLFYDHMDILPSGDIPLSKSMIVQALRGSGKTQIRQCIIARLPQNNQILIKIYGIDIHKYLDNFVNNIDITTEPAYEKIRKYWTKEHFLQIILTEIASRFINEKYFLILKEKKNTIPLQTRKEMANLLIFYSTKDSDTLCKIINLLLYEITECSIINCRIRCNNGKLGDGDPEMFKSLEDRHRKIKVKRQTTGTDASLRLLLAVYEKTKSSPLPYLDRSYRDQTASLINFLTTLGISTTVMVDSLDESTFFFDSADRNLRTLQTFVDSTTNDDILHLALGNWGEGITVANSFSVYILIPKRQNVSMTISWTRKDKIPIT